MISRRRMLAGAAVTIASPAWGPAWGEEMAGLRTLAAVRGFVFGCETSTYELKDPLLAATLAHEAALLVPGWQMKRRDIEQVRGVLDFSTLDEIFAFARARQLAMRGHPLVWHIVNPPWLAEALAAKKDETLLTGYVSAMLRHYRGGFTSVDVVNEAIAEDGKGLRPSLWLSAFGPAYVDMAFHAAKAADPGTLLVYNDYGSETGDASGDRLRAATLDFLDGLLRRGVPVEALGMQGHLSAFGPRVDQRKLHDFLGEIRARGLGLLVTELDVEDSGGPSDIASRDRAVADETSRFLDVVLEAPNLRAILTWGLTDRYLDPPDDWKLRLRGWQGRKLPYDAQMRPVAMRAAMAASFAAARPNLRL